MTANDALIIINKLAQKGGSGSGENGSADRAPMPESDAYKWDVDKKGILSAKDALQVINYIAMHHQQSSNSATAEFVPEQRSLNDDQESHSETPAIVASTTDRVFTQWDSNPQPPIPYAAPLTADTDAQDLDRPEDLVRSIILFHHRA